MRTHPLQQAMFARGQATGDVALLPMLTSRSEPILESAMSLFDEWVRTNAPTLPVDRRILLIEIVVRLLLSHVMVSLAEPEQVAAALTRTARALSDAPGA